MIVLKHGFKTYKPRLTIDACLQLEELYGNVMKPLENKIPSLEDCVFIISLSLQYYMLDEEVLFEIIDEIEDIVDIVIRLYKDSGLVNTEETETETETTKSEPTESEHLSFEQMCDDMLKNILESNLMSIEQFYASTLKEIILQAKCYSKYKNNVAIEKAIQTYQLADLTSQAVARLMSKDAKMPEFNKYFKHLLEDADLKPTNSDDELSADEKAVSVAIREWAMAMQRKQEKQRPKEVE